MSDSGSTIQGLEERDLSSWTMSERGFSGEGFQFGVFELDSKTGELRKEGRLVHLRNQPFQVLSVLLNRAGELVTRDEMKAALWADNAEVDVEQGLNYCIKEIRTALGDSADSPRFVQTLPRRGYRFLADVRRVSAIESPALAATPAAAAVEPAVAGVTLPRRRLAFAGAAIALITMVAVLVLARRSTTIAIPPGPPRVVVLPFSDLSSKPESYLADGLTDELISSLGQKTRGQLSVIARSSSLVYRTRPQDPAAFARELRATHFIEGSVRRDGSRLRVIVSAARSSDGTQVWSETYDRDVVDLLSLEREVVEAIGKGIQVAVSTESASHAPVNVDAYMDYLRGRYAWSKRTREGLLESLEIFESITQKHPESALGWAGLADSYSVLMDQGLLSPKDGWVKARSAAEKAVRLDPGLAEAWTNLGMIRGLYEWNAKGADEAFERAAALNPTYATRLHWQSILQRADGRFQEAYDNLRAARDLDPLSLVIRVNLAGVLLDLGEIQQARLEAQSVLSQAPNWGPGLLLMGSVFSRLKQFDEAEASYLKAVTAGAPAARTELVALYVMTKKRDLAIKTLGEMEAQSKTSYVSPYLMAVAAAGVDPERAFKALEAAFAERSPALRSLRRDPRFDPIRKDPRFDQLVRVLWPEDAASR